MRNQNTKDKMLEKFTWTIRNFSTIDSNELYSDSFFLDNHTWRILMFPKGDNVDYLSIYVDAGGDPAYLPRHWKKYAYFKLALINQVNEKMNKIKEFSHMFNASKIELGFSRFIPLDELCDSSRGFIVNDTCIIQVEILANKSEHENQVDKSVSKIDDDKHVECTDNRLPKEMISASSDKLVDFRGIGKVEQDFVPLLEEVCSRHPSLIDSKQKKSQRFIEWAFTALCRVLHFLKTKRVKDMDDDDACKHLQNLWEELEVFRFDLTWLEPHVQSALSMKNYMEKVALV
ncbi:hypothetical protein GLYMA_10G088100v4, partial [Glycine max]